MLCCGVWGMGYKVGGVGIRVWRGMGHGDGVWGVCAWGVGIWGMRVWRIQTHTNAQNYTLIGPSIPGMLSSDLFDWSWSSIPVMAGSDRVDEQRDHPLPVSACALALWDMIGSFRYTDQRAASDYHWRGCWQLHLHTIVVQDIHVQCLRFHLLNCGMWDGTNRPCGRKHPGVTPTRNTIVWPIYVVQTTHFLTTLFLATIYDFKHNF